MTLINICPPEQNKNSVRHGGSLVDSSPFIRRVMGSNPTLAGTLGKSFIRSCLWHFDVKLQHNIRAVLGAPLSSSGLEEAL